MKKTQATALWTQLSPEQQKTLDKWLFEQKLGYAKTLPRAQKELGFKGSISSLKRYYMRRKQEMIIEDFTELRKYVAELDKEPTDPYRMHLASMKLLGGYLFQAVHEAPEDVDKWSPVARVILEHEHIELLRELKGEENRLREEGMKFAKQKFHFDTMEKALKALPQLRELAEARKDPKTKQAERDERLEEIRLMMFGDEDEDEEEEEMLQAPNAQASAVAEAMADKPENPEDPNDEESNAQ